MPKLLVTTPLHNLFFYLNVFFFLEGFLENVHALARRVPHLCTCMLCNLYICAITCRQKSTVMHVGGQAVHLQSRDRHRGACSSSLGAAPCKGELLGQGGEAGHPRQAETGCLQRGNCRALLCSVQLPASNQCPL